MKFTEAKLEKAFIELLATEGFEHQHGATIVRAAGEVLLEADLIVYLLKKYGNQNLTETEAKSIVLQLKTLPASDLYETNKKVMRMLRDGFILKREDRSQKDLYIELIDYNGLAAQLAGNDLDTIVAEPTVAYASDSNIYKFVNQLEIVGNELRIPDGILYINGLPLVVFEFKSAIREEATVHDAFTQLTVRYRRDIPELFKYNAFCVISDGANSKAGSFFAPYDAFYAWRRVAGLAKDVDGISSLFTLDTSSPFLGKRVRRVSMDLQSPHHMQHFMELVSDVQICIISFLSVEDAKKVMCTSKYMHHLIQNQTFLWKQWCFQQWPNLPRDAVFVDESDKCSNGSAHFNKGPFKFSVQKPSLRQSTLLKTSSIKSIEPNYSKLLKQRARDYPTFVDQSVPRVKITRPPIVFSVLAPTKIQFTGTVGTGDRCIRSDKPLAKPEQL